MTSEDHRRLQELLGAYLLDELDEGEREAVRAHLDRCEVCQSEIRELGPVIAALAYAAPDRIEDTPEPPEDLEEFVLGPVLREARHARRQRLLRRASLAAAAAILLMVAGSTFLPRLLEPEVPLEPVSITGEPPGVEAEANLIDHTWGTETRLTVSGLEDGQPYRVALHDEDGTLVPSGAFIGTGDEPMQCNLNAALLRENATGLEVRDANGSVVLESDFPNVADNGEEADRAAAQSPPKDPDAEEPEPFASQTKQVPEQDLAREPAFGVEENAAAQPGPPQIVDSSPTSTATTQAQAAPTPESAL